VCEYRPGCCVGRPNFEEPREASSVVLRCGGSGAKGHEQACDTASGEQRLQHLFLPSVIGRSTLSGAPCLSVALRSRCRHLERSLVDPPALEVVPTCLPSVARGTDVSASWLRLLWTASRKRASFSTSIGRSTIPRRRYEGALFLGPLGAGDGAAQYQCRPGPA